MKKYYLYKHINKINGKIYIGITSQKPEKRWGTNGINYRNNKYF
jgi:predicted GIY-YIG superfamily endonuclease